MNLWMVKGEMCDGDESFLCWHFLTLDIMSDIVRYVVMPNKKRINRVEDMDMSFAVKKYASVCLVVLMGASFPLLLVADWAPEDGHKMHWPQLPDLSPNGIDINATSPYVMADDFRCSKSGKITDVHIWGSWLNDIRDTNAVFVLSIHSDIPTNEIQTFSMPGTSLWFKVFAPGMYVTTNYAVGIEEGWMDPPNMYIPPPADTECVQYNFFIDPGEAFTQVSGTVYWLDVQCLTAGELFGWKTCEPEWRWNDDATWTTGEEPNLTGWTNLVYPSGHLLEGETLDMAFVITGGDEENLDFGDAPDPTYPTLLASIGANHVIVAGFHLGLSVDPEPDGQPDAHALGDDTDGNNDDDGILFTSGLIPGKTTTLNVVASLGGGFLNAWVDFDVNGSWGDPGEQIFTDKALSIGTNALSFAVPLGSRPGLTFCRFRFSTATGLSYTGSTADGEVEDYEVHVEEEPLDLDFGDADDVPYFTLLARNGARHVIVSNVYLGAGVDVDMDGQPDGTATGDDLDGNDDEDGVFLPSYLLQGQMAGVTVVASVPGFLSGWIDFSADGDWDDSGEHIFAGHPLMAGTNVLAFPVPSYGAASPQSRFRFTTNFIPTLSYTGLVSNGEVEDYEVNIVGSDYGDAPTSYLTMFSNNGARHIISGGVHLGQVTPDHENDGQPSTNALGDDITGTFDDEDGVILITALSPGNRTLVDVVASGVGILNAWVDFNTNGNWSDSAEQVFTNVLMASGTNKLSFDVPCNAGPGKTFARFRFNTSGGLSYTGVAMDGEVEDYEFRIEEPIAFCAIGWNGTNYTFSSVGYFGSGMQVLEYSTNLVATNWAPILTNIAPLLPPKTNFWTITPFGTSAFYRVIQP